MLKKAAALLLITLCFGFILKKYGFSGNPQGISGMFDCYLTDKAPPEAAMLNIEEDSVIHYPTGNKDTLDILSWNIYMLPSFALHNKKYKRARAIGDLLKDTDYDVIVFQEAFNAHSLKILSGKLKDAYPYQLEVGNREFINFRFTSGIWFVSKIPLKKLGEIKFSNCQGWDNCSAKKGAVMVEGQLGGKKFQVLGTHLNAGGSRELRMDQLTQIREKLLLPNTVEGVPQFLCGDFNISQCDEEKYEEMLGILEAQNSEPTGPQLWSVDAWVNKLLSHNPDNVKMIDFIFDRSNGRLFQDIRRSVKIFRSRIKGSDFDLSDHFAIEARVVF